MRASELDYELPGELIAQRPLERRDQSRLLVYRRASRELSHRRVADLPGLLQATDVVVVNDSRVIPARIRARRPGGGEAEVLLVEQRADGTWEALARPSRKLGVGLVLSSGTAGDSGRGGTVELLDRIEEGRWRVQLRGAPRGETPIPPYISEPLDDPDRYQTVYAARPGSVAAPTAGLHLTPALLEQLDPVRCTLHVGPDSFRPVRATRVEEHRLGGERYEIGASAWERIASGQRVVALGTTSVRVIETVAAGGPLEGRASLLVTPGFEFRRVGALMTNFHPPRSPLLALVMAFVGVEEARCIYQAAIAERYRFYSFGDAMLVVD